MAKKLTGKDRIWIGGAPYKRKCQYKGWKVTIVSYDVNTERHITIRHANGETERIELDNDQLILTDI